MLERRISQRARSVRRYERMICAAQSSEDQVVECFCCGEERDPTMVASLQCHDEIKVCRVCVGSLRGRTGGIDVTPTLAVASCYVPAALSRG